MDSFEFGEVNIKDVAKKAGVSIATVSLALNGKGRISEKTREKIKRIADELGYISNRQAAAFRTGRSKTIGFVIQSRKSPASHAVWRSEVGQILFDLVSAAVKRGYAVIAIPSGDIKSLKQFNIAGLILSDSLEDDPDYKAAVSLGIPVATNERPDLPNIAAHINVGYREMTMAALDLLKSRGAKKPALLTEPADLYPNYQAELAYLDWCRENKVKPIVARGAYDRSDIEKQVTKLINSGTDAIYSFYEEGPEILEILNRKKLSSPKDIMLIANSLYNDDANKALGISSTVYHYDLELETFMNNLIDVIEEKVEPGIVVNVPWELNEYQSTKR